MNISESLIRELTIQAIKELGDSATPELVKKVVLKSLDKIPEAKIEEKLKEDSGRIIITAFGVNQPGVVSTISTILAENQCDIQDITQKILQEFFTLIMIVDISNSPASFKELQTKLSEAAEKLKIKVFVQHEDVFKFMHRI